MCQWVDVNKFLDFSRKYSKALVKSGISLAFKQRLICVMQFFQVSFMQNVPMQSVSHETAVI